MSTGNISSTKTPKKVNWNDIQIIDAVGQGGFGVVHKVKITNKSLLSSKNYKPKGLPTSTYFALKSNSKSPHHSDESIGFAIEALNNEIEILSTLNHENIIKLCGVPPSNNKQSNHENKKDKPKNNYMLLELLDETLDHRMLVWKAHMRRLFQQSCKNRKIFSQMEWLEQQQTEHMYHRIQQVALDVAQGMEYLHANDIILRDLKPDNIGFDNNGKVKLFDFGLACTVQQRDRTKGEVAGSYRYMSPESMNGEVCSKHFDVYSFGILLWKICTLQLPYLTIPSDEAICKRVRHGYRPSLKNIKDPKLSALIAQCWHIEPEQRISFPTIYEVLSEVIRDFNTSKQQQQITRKVQKNNCLNSSSAVGLTQQPVSQDNDHKNDGERFQSPVLQAR